MLFFLYSIYTQSIQIITKFQEKISEIGTMSQLMTCRTSAANEVDALKSRWQAAKTTADQWESKMVALVEHWNHFNLLMEELR